jgi:multidrug resistance efflux pump
MDEVEAKAGLTGSEREVKDPTQTAPVKKAVAYLVNAEQKFRRSKELAEQGIMARQTYEEDDANYKPAQATYDLAVQNVGTYKAALKERRACSGLGNKKLLDTTRCHERPVRHKCKLP